MEIRFYECNFMEETSFARRFKDDLVTIYIGTEETRNKEQLLKDLESTGLIKAGASNE